MRGSREPLDGKLGRCPARTCSAIRPCVPAEAGEAVPPLPWTSCAGMQEGQTLQRSGDPRRCRTRAARMADRDGRRRGDRRGRARLAVAAPAAAGRLPPIVRRPAPSLTLPRERGREGWGSLRRPVRAARRCGAVVPADRRPARARSPNRLAEAAQSARLLAAGAERSRRWRAGRGVRRLPVEAHRDQHRVHRRQPGGAGR